MLRMRTIRLSRIETRENDASDATRDVALAGGRRARHQNWHRVDGSAISEDNATAEYCLSLFTWLSYRAITYDADRSNECFRPAEGVLDRPRLRHGLPENRAGLRRQGEGASRRRLCRRR